MLWDRVIKFVRWQHPAVGREARFVVRARHFLLLIYESLEVFVLNKLSHSDFNICSQSQRVRFRPQLKRCWLLVYIIKKWTRCLWTI